MYSQACVQQLLVSSLILFAVISSAEAAESVDIAPASAAEPVAAVPSSVLLTRPLPPERQTLSGQAASTAATTPIRRKNQQVSEITEQPPGAIQALQGRFNRDNTRSGPSIQPSSEPQTTTETLPFKLSQLQLGMSRSQAYSLLHQQFDQLKQRTVSALETRLVLPSSPQNGHIHTSYRLLMAKQAPEHLNEIQVSWISAVYSGSDLHLAVLKALQKAFGAPLQWHNAIIDVVQREQQQLGKQRLKLQQLQQMSEYQPVLGVLKNIKQRRLARQRHEILDLAESHKLSAKQVCAALELKLIDCHLTNQLIRAGDGSLSSERRNCRYWLKPGGEMLSACEMSGGTLVRLSRPMLSTGPSTIVIPL